MHAYLTRLAVMPEVQAYFKPFFFSDDRGDLRFNYTDCDEHYGFSFHRVPSTNGLWLAGNLQFAQVRLAILSASALDAVAWLNKNFFSFKELDGLLFISFGNRISEDNLQWIANNLKSAQFRLIFTNDVLGRCADLKLAAAIRKVPLAIYTSDYEHILVCFRAQNYYFRQELLSLHAFEKASGFRFRIATSKSKSYNSFFDELRAGSGL